MWYRPPLTVLRTSRPITRTDSIDCGICTWRMIGRIISCCYAFRLGPARAAPIHDGNAKDGQIS